MRFGLCGQRNCMILRYGLSFYFYQMKAFFFGTVLLFLLLQTGCFYYIEHNPPLALETARRFSLIAYVQRDLSKAMAFLPPERVNEVSEVDLENLIVKMHPENDYPIEITPIGYETVPGVRRINVYLVGRSATKSSYYRIGFEGDRRTGYFVTEMYRQFKMFEVGSLYKSVTDRPIE